MIKHRFYLLADKKHHPIKVLDMLQKWIGEIADFELGMADFVEGVDTAHWGQTMKRMAKVREIAEGLKSEENNNYIIYIKEVSIE